MTDIRIYPLGDCAVTVEFGNDITADIMDKVRSFDAALSQSPPAGVTDLVPTYRSLTIHYDPLLCTYDDIQNYINHALGRSSGTVTATAQRWSVPVCYDGDHALDQVAYSAAINLDAETIINAHQDCIFTLAMFGFMPGCAYLAGLPDRLHIPRRSTPRPQVPPGSILIGGQQAMLASVAMPTGWYMIGQTPVSIFDADASPVTPFNVGDEIRFRAIAKQDWNTARIERLT